ncbi:hypothetical protein DAI22_04g277800 [Oryza sativa Japonica Group]|nr:hypothetical protein DAI22_04g277800 [Oryza sativa Japonica Group]
MRLLLWQQYEETELVFLVAWILERKVTCLVMEKHGTGRCRLLASVYCYASLTSR